MLEDLIDIFYAREQVMLLLGALGLILLGGALIVDFVMMRLKARSYRGKICGAREQSVSSTKAGRVYFPVVEYTDESGLRRQAETDAGSSGLADKAPGRTVRLLVVPGRPHEARITGYSRLVFSGIFIASGILLGGFAAANYAVNPWTYIVGLVILGALGGMGARKLIIMKGQGGEPGPPDKDNKYKERLKEKQSLKFIGPEELHLRLKEQNAKTKRWAPVAVAVALILIGVGHYLAEDLYVFLLKGKPAAGEIVGYERRRDSSMETVYYPTVEFSDPSGNVVRFMDRVGSSSPGSGGKSNVEVLYLPENPESAMIDRGMGNWAAPGGILFLGFLLLSITLKSWYRILFTGAEGKLPNRSS